MTRQEIETIRVGQTGLYCWNRSLPVVSVYPVSFDRNVMAFRYVLVESATGNGTIGFIVAEGQSN